MLGKFLKTEHFSVHEHYTNHVFPAKVFIFEKCLLYAKVNLNTGDKKKLSYRDHFMFGSSLSVQMKVILA